MKKLKFTKVGSLLLFVAIASMAVISGCKDDAVVDPEADFTALKAKIVDAEALISSTTEGTDVGQYEIGSQLTLHKVVTSAEIVVASKTSDQTAVDNTVNQLQGAMDTYGTKIIEAIDPATLVGHWKFDEGSGTTVADDASGFDGAFNTGRANWGAGDPAWAEDRNGNAGKAIKFDEGAWIEVPYNTALNPKQITISLWVKADSVRANNRFLGLQSWIGYKFQLQSANFPFFTAGTDEGAWDRDAGSTLNLGQWYHLAVSYASGEMIFYIDGFETYRETNNTYGDMSAITGHNLAIGVGSSKYADTTGNFENDKIIPEEWGGYFNGSLDELRIYNTVLSGPQVKSIYNDEK